MKGKNIALVLVVLFLVGVVYFVLNSAPKEEMREGGKDNIRKDISVKRNGSYNESRKY